MADRAGKGQSIPFPIEPDRVAAEGILSEEMIGFAPQNLSLDEKQWAYKRRLTFLRKLREYCYVSMNHFEAATATTSCPPNRNQGN